MLTHRRRLLWFVVEAGIASTALAPALAFDDAAFCAAARQFALAVSKDAGLWIDRIVRNDGMAVSCGKRTVEFKRSINAGSAFLTAGWKDRKSEEWNAAHCNSPIWAEATVLSNMTEGVCLFDPDQKLVICNARYAEIYQLPPELALPGTSLHQILGHRIADGLINEESQRIIEEEVAENKPVTKSIKLNDGRVIAIKHQPVVGGGWVSTHEDITVREHLSVELRQQKEQLNIALENMSQGLAMFDRHQRVIVCNRRYAEMYGLTLDQVKPGTTVREIAEHRIAKGLFAGSSPQAYLQERVGRVIKDTDVIHKLSDGRVIALSVRVMPDGSGVSTHDDITERENLKERLDAALNNMAQGLAMFDREQKLVICNKRFAEMYGLRPDQVQPGTTGRELIEYCIENGCYAGKNLDDMVASTMKRLPAGSSKLR